MGIRTALTATSSVLIAAGSTAPAFGQDRGPMPSIAAGSNAGSYETFGFVSPSSATATISPSNVPQAMERMADDTDALDLSLGTVVAEGEFGTGSTTTIWNSALGARLNLDDLTLSASLPWMRIDSRSTIFAGIDATPVLVAPNTSLRKRITDGFGDLTLGASYTIAQALHPVEIELSGRAKLNTADKNSRLSSGKNDYALGVDFSIPTKRVTPFASFTYRFLGDTESYRLRDGPAASAGATYPIGDGTFVVASYHYAKAATRLVGDSHELFAGASTRLSGTRLRLTGFATAGLSDGAAGVSAGVALSVGLWKRGSR